MTALTLGLAGCTSDDGGGGDGEDRDTMTAEDAETTPTDTATETVTPTETETETEQETETETETPAEEVSLTLGDPELVEADLGYTTRPAGQITVENTGNAPSEQVDLTFDWFDDSGEYLASDSTYCHTIGAGEVWQARARPISVENEEDVSDVEVALSGGSSPASLGADGVKLVNSQLRASEDDVIVRGEAANNRDSSLSYLEAIAKVYDGDGQLITTEFTNETEIASGGTWRFEINVMTTGRNGDVESAEVILDT